MKKKVAENGGSNGNIENNGNNGNNMRSKGNKNVGRKTAAATAYQLVGIVMENRPGVDSGGSMLRWKMRKWRKGS